MAIQISVALTYVEQDVLQPVPIIPKSPAYYYIIIFFNAFEFLFSKLCFSVICRGL